MYTRNELIQISGEIFNQLGGFGSVRLMIGAYDIKAWEEMEEPILSFKFKGSREYNYVKIILTVMDTYTMVLGQIVHKKGIPEYIEKVTIEDLYCDTIKETFESKTGLYLTLTP